MSALCTFRSSGKKTHSNSVYLHFPHEGAQMEFRMNVRYSVFHPDWSSLSWQLIMSRPWESEVSAVVIRLLVSVMHYEHVNVQEGGGGPRGVEHRSRRCLHFWERQETKTSPTSIQFSFFLEPSLRAMRQSASAGSFKAALSMPSLQMLPYYSAIFCWN